MRGVKAQIPLNAQMLFYDGSVVSEIQVVDKMGRPHVRRLNRMIGLKNVVTHLF